MERKYLNFIIETLNRIKTLEARTGKSNPEVIQAFQKHWDLFYIEYIKNKHNLLFEIGDYSKSLRKSLSYSEPCNYEFIANIPVKERLKKDWEWMNFYQYDFSKNEYHRYFYFCLYAFFQIEELINYHYYRRFRNLSDFVIYLQEEISDQNGSRQKRTFYKPKIKEGVVTPIENVGQVDSNFKIRSFSREFLFSGTERKIMNSLKSLRNDGVHRCSTVEMNENIESFLRQKDYNIVRKTLNSIIKTVRIETPRFINSQD